MATDETASGKAILQAAADLFGERGYKAATTRAIAERAGVNEVTLFRRFGSKRGVLEALGELWREQMAGFAVSASPDPSDVRTTLLSLARMEVRQATAFGASAMRLALDARSVPEVAEVLGGGPGQNLAGLAGYLGVQQEAGAVRDDVDARVLAEGFFLITSTLVMSRALLGRDDEALSPEQAVDQLMEVYLSGIVPPRQVAR
jgi:AcrR family transcriptional regulator